MAENRDTERRIYRHKRRVRNQIIAYGRYDCGNSGRRYFCGEIYYKMDEGQKAGGNG